MVNSWLTFYTKKKKVTKIIEGGEFVVNKVHEALERILQDLVQDIQATKGRNKKNKLEAKNRVKKDGGKLED